MRRSDREVSRKEEILHILDSSKVLHLGLAEDGMPYVIPLNYGYTMDGDKLTFYVHGALEGRKLDVIRKAPACCVQIDCDGALIAGQSACRYGYSYYSLIGFGKAAVVENAEEKMRALALLMKEQTAMDFAFNEEMAALVSVIRIDCESYTAKHCPMPAGSIGTE